MVQSKYIDSGLSGSQLGLGLTRRHDRNLAHLSILTLQGRRASYWRSTVGQRNVFVFFVEIASVHNPFRDAGGLAIFATLRQRRNEARMLSCTPSTREN